jgi:type II secretory pathway component PulK
MRNIIGLALIPLICMIVTILTAVVVIFALRRGTRAINEQAQDIIAQKQQTRSGNTRWARADLQAEELDAPEPEPTIPCAACGGENKASRSTCSFCGSKLTA